MNKRIINLLLFILILTGLAFATVPFLSSYQPPETSTNKNNNDAINNSNTVEK